jgi:hypothetical protein
MRRIWKEAGQPIVSIRNINKLIKHYKDEKTRNSSCYEQLNKKSRKRMEESLPIHGNHFISACTEYGLCTL